jgi:hypothetical protein
MPIVYNIGDIQKAMVMVAELVIEDVSKELLDKFKKDYVQKYVYDSHGENSVYENPHGNEFMEAWMWDDLQKSATGVSKKMFYNWTTMGLNAYAFGYGNPDAVNTGIHASNVDGWDMDERKYLMETLDKSGPSSKLWVSVKRPGGYWQTFINDYISGGKLRNMVAKYAKMRGLEIK